MWYKRSVHNVLATTETPAWYASHDTTDCSVPGSVRQAPRRHVQPGTREFRPAAPSCSRRLERVYGLVKAFARCLADKRAPGKIRHTLADLIGQRVFGIACGHPDGNDADHLADDPIHKLLLGRDPVSGAPLASQPSEIPSFYHVNQ